MGRAILAKGVELEPLTDDCRGRRQEETLRWPRKPAFTLDGIPATRILADDLPGPNGFDKTHYKFDYVRREFLGEVRTLVFDVTPLPKTGKGRFVGRIWVEDQDSTSSGLNGAYGGGSRTNYYFHFDSWRVNSGPKPVASRLYLQRRVRPELRRGEAAFF